MVLHISFFALSGFAGLYYVRRNFNTLFDWSNPKKWPWYECWSNFVWMDVALYVCRLPTRILTFPICGHRFATNSIHRFAIQFLHLSISEDFNLITFQW